MSHRDLPAQAGWYEEQYAGDPSSDNHFGSESLVERRPNTALQHHLSLGGSITTFQAVQDEERRLAGLPVQPKRTVEETLAMLDLALAGKGGAK